MYKRSLAYRLKCYVLFSEESRRSLNGESQTPRLRSAAQSQILQCKGHNIFKQTISKLQKSAIKVLSKFASTLFNCFMKHFLNTLSNNVDILIYFLKNQFLEFSSFVVWDCVLFTIKTACHFVHRFRFFFILNLQRKNENLRTPWH